MPIKNLLIQMEKRGFMDTVVTAHKVERPAAVMRGEESDRFNIEHQSYCVYKPNNVAIAKAKAGNLAGLVGYKALESSKHLTLVWRNWDSHGFDLFACCPLFLNLVEPSQGVTQK
ncbi:Uncharacterized protein SCF082_LOCUS32255 [Durusdinium trenchii]